MMNKLSPEIVLRQYKIIFDNFASGKELSEDWHKVNDQIIEAIESMQEIGEMEVKRMREKEDHKPYDRVVWIAGSKLKRGRVIKVCHMTNRYTIDGDDGVEYFKHYDWIAKEEAEPLSGEENEGKEMSFEQLSENCKHVKHIITKWIEEVGRLMERVQSRLKVDQHYYGKIFFQYQNNVVCVFKIPEEVPPEMYTKLKLIKHVLEHENPTEYGATYEKRITFERKGER